MLVCLALLDESTSKGLKMVEKIDPVVIINEPSRGKTNNVVSEQV